MSRTIQKKVKFSHGQIDERLQERQDLAVLDSSASEITNMVSTPYGSVKSRQGTINIEDFQPEVEIDAITIGTSSANPTFVEASVIDGGFYKATNLGQLADDTEIFTIDVGSSKKIYQFDFSMYFNGVNSTDSIRTSATGGAVTDIWAPYNYRNIKEPEHVYKTSTLTISELEDGEIYLESSLDIFDSASVGKTITLTGIGDVVVSQYFNSTYIEASTVGVLDSFDPYTDFVFDGVTYGATLTIDNIANGNVTFVETAGTSFSSSVSGDYFTLEYSISGFSNLCIVSCEIVDAISSTSVRASIKSPLHITTVDTWKLVTSPTILDITGGTGTGASAEIYVTGYLGNTPTRPTIVSGGTGYTDSTFSTGLDLDLDSTNLESSTVTLQTSTDNITYTDVQTIEITNSLLDGDDLKSIIIDAAVRYIRIISDKVNGEYYIGSFFLRPARYNNARIERFEFNEDEQYLIIFSDSLITIYDGAEFYRVTTTIADNFITDLNISQKDDVMIIAHPDFAPLQLTRGDSAANLLPTLTTGETTSGGFTFDSIRPSSVYNASDNYTSTFYTNHEAIEEITTINEIFTSSAYDDYVEVAFPTTTAVLTTRVTYSYGQTVLVQKQIGGVYTTVATLNNSKDRTTESVTINDSIDGIRIVIPTYIELIETDNQPISGISFTIRKYNYTGGRVHELDVYTSVVGDWTLATFDLKNIPKHNFDSEPPTAKTSTLTPDVPEGLVTITSNGSDFTSASEGQYIDGGGGRLKITEYISATKVRGISVIPFYTIDAFTNWDYITGYEDVWSATRGYPNCVLFYQERLWFGGSKSRPGTLWASRISDFNNFLNIGNYSNDAIDVTISANQPIEILSLYPNRGIQVFATGSEWIIPEGNLTPDSIAITKNTANGIKRGVEPIDIAGTTLFAEKNGKSLLSFVYNEGQNAYVTSQISLLTSLIDQPIDIDVAYNSAQNEANYVYIVNADGNMVVACILLDQKINSYVKFETDGLYKDVCVIGDTVYVLVLRDSGLYLEKFSDDSPVDCRRSARLICGIEGDTQQVYAPYDFNNQELQVYAGTELLGTVTGSGVVSDQTSGTVYMGIPIDYSLTSNKMAVNNYTESIHSRISEATVVANNTEKLIFCDETLEQSDDDSYQFRGCTSPARDTRFTVTGTFDKIEVLSVLLKLNYGSR